MREAAARFRRFYLILFMRQVLGMREFHGRLAVSFHFIYHLLLLAIP